MPAENSDNVQVQKAAIIALLSELSSEDLQEIFEQACGKDDWKEYIITQYEENFSE